MDDGDVRFPSLGYDALLGQVVSGYYPHLWTYSIFASEALNIGNLIFF